MTHEVDGSVHCAEVMRHVETMDDPVTLDVYAKEHDLLKIDGCKRLRQYVKNEKKFKHQMKQVKINSMRHGPRIKFG
eukprot:11827585-Ditylum_brightwellii.AAC.1